MKAYLAAAWTRREEILAVSKRLEAVGVEITSHWLTEETTGANPDRFLRDRAYIDLADVDRADVLVRFTDVGNPEVADGTVSVKLISGARHTEFGYAMAKGKSLIVVGGKQNIFDRKDGIVHLKDADALVEYLGGR